MAILSPGLLSGSSTELGDFDQCLSIDGAFQGRQFTGKYCLATVHLQKTELFKPLELNRTLLKPAWIADTIEQWHNNDNWFALANGVCFPSVCDADEIRSILQACKCTCT